jgi:hypothetical protein
MEISTGETICKTAKTQEGYNNFVASVILKSVVILNPHTVSNNAVKLMYTSIQHTLNPRVNQNTSVAQGLHKNQ